MSELRSELRMVYISIMVLLIMSAVFSISIIYAIGKACT